MGVEIEWITSLEGKQPPLAVLKEALTLPTHGRLTLEPGGQIEISSTPGDLAAVIREISADAQMVRDYLISRGVETVGVGMDERADVERLLDEPRYEAMEAHLDRRGPEGRRMMRRTAAVQVNISPGQDPQARWRVLGALAPVFTAMFANSPSPTSRAGRVQNWFAMDPTRTSPVPIVGDLGQTWADAALDAHVMMVRPDDEHAYVAPEGLSFRDWIREGIPDAGYPTLGDLDYHLTTLFPPVRARGWFELRVIDAQEDPYAHVPFAIAAAAILSDEAAGIADPALFDSWPAAIDTGLEDPRLRDAAVVIGKIALAELRHIDEAVMESCRAFLERYTFAGRTPADDRSTSSGEAA